MKGRIIDFSMSFGGKQRVTLELDTDFREGYEALKEAVLEIVIKKWRAKRSKDQNAYFHLLVNEIAIAKGLSDDQVKVDLVTQYGTYARDDEGMIVGFKLPASVDVSTIKDATQAATVVAALKPEIEAFRKTLPPGYVLATGGEVEESGKLFKCYLVYKQTRLMDTKEMSHLIDGAVQVAQELGIDTDTPEQRSRHNEYMNK